MSSIIPRSSFLDIKDKDDACSVGVIIHTPQQQWGPYSLKKCDRAKTRTLLRALAREASHVEQKSSPLKREHSTLEKYRFLITSGELSLFSWIFQMDRIISLSFCRLFSFLYEQRTLDTVEKAFRCTWWKWVHQVYYTKIFRKHVRIYFVKIIFDCHSILFERTVIRIFNSHFNPCLTDPLSFIASTRETKKTVKLSTSTINFFNNITKYCSRLLWATYEAQSFYAFVLRFFYFAFFYFKCLLPVQ